MVIVRDAVQVDGNQGNLHQMNGINLIADTSQGGAVALASHIRTSY